jgi:hypothetical protein
MARLNSLLLSVLIVVASGWESVSAQEPAPTVEIIDETIDPVWSVSGYVLVGVMTATGQSPEPKLSIGASSAPGEIGIDQVFCTDIVSRARSYRGRANIYVPSGAQRPVVVPFIDFSRYADLLSTVQDDEMAIRVRYGACDDVDDNSSIPATIARWGEAATAEPLRKITLLLNARTSEAAVRLSAAGVVFAQQHCERVSEPQRTGYDFICRMKLKNMDEQVSEIDGMIVRREFGQVRPPAHFAVRLRD